MVSTYRAPSPGIHEGVHLDRRALCAEQIERQQKGTIETKSVRNHGQTLNGINDQLFDDEQVGAGTSARLDILGDAVGKQSRIGGDRAIAPTRDRI